VGVTVGAGVSVIVGVNEAVGGMEDAAGVVEVDVQADKAKITTSRNSHGWR